MYYVYIIQSLSNPDKTYRGVTRNIESRMQKHNSGHVKYTASFVPWEVVSYVALKDKNKAYAFEKYLKSHSGRAFSNKRLI